MINSSPLFFARFTWDDTIISTEFCRNLKCSPGSQLAPLDLLQSSVYKQWHVHRAPTNVSKIIFRIARRDWCGECREGIIFFPCYDRQTVLSQSKKALWILTSWSNYRVGIRSNTVLAPYTNLHTSSVLRYKTTITQQGREPFPTMTTHRRTKVNISGTKGDLDWGFHLAFTSNTRIFKGTRVRGLSFIFQIYFIFGRGCGVNSRCC